MTKTFTITIVCLLSCISLAFAQAFSPIAEVRTDMVAAAQAFANSLDQTQREKALLPFEDKSQKDWNNLPTHSFARQGLPLGEMNDQQKMALHSLLQTGLSAQGYLKAQRIIEQDQQHRLDVFEESGFETDRTMYGHDYYYLSIFGEPANDQLWGWSFEGHHLSLNFTLSNQDISVTPMFVGVDPREIMEGPYAGYSVMDEESDIAWKLINSLDQDQQTEANMKGKMPDDILTRTGEEPHTQNVIGLPYSQMTASQQYSLKALLRAWVLNLNYTLAEQEMAKIDRAGIESLHFAWSGDSEQRKPKYYRIHGPATIIEYDNRSYEQWHIHSLWRSLSEDFGQMMTGQ